MQAPYSLRVKCCGIRVLGTFLASIFVDFLLHLPDEDSNLYPHKAALILQAGYALYYSSIYITAEGSNDDIIDVNFLCCQIITASNTPGICYLENYVYDMMFQGTKVLTVHIDKIC